MMRSLGRAPDDGSPAGSAAHGAGNAGRPAWCDEMPPDGPEWNAATDGAAWSVEDDAARAAAVNADEIVNFQQICGASEDEARAFLECHGGLDAAVSAYVEEYNGPHERHVDGEGRGSSATSGAADDDAIAKVVGFCSTDIDTARAFVERYTTVDAAVEVKTSHIHTRSIYPRSLLFNLPTFTLTRPRPPRSVFFAFHQHVLRAHPRLASPHPRTNDSLRHLWTLVASFPTMIMTVAVMVAALRDVTGAARPFERGLQLAQLSWTGSTRFVS
jgi:hypothetical protein